MASIYGFEYFGVDLSKIQIEENNKQFKELKLIESEIKSPNWILGDSFEIDKLLSNQKFDLMFSCPPYADLEIYSNNPKDISNMNYENFLKTYREIIKKCYDLLETDTFVVWVVGEIRNKKSKDGRYVNFVADTITAFTQAGFLYYNEIIYVTPNGSLPLRIEKQFRHSRKIGKKHQNILVFCKGNPINASNKLEPPEFLKNEEI